MSGREQESAGIPGIGDLPRAMAPRGDPWPRIERRIAAAAHAPDSRRRPGNRWRVSAIAASALAAVLLVVFSRPGTGPDGGVTEIVSTEISPSPGTRIRVPVPAQAGMLEGTESEYRGALLEFRSVVASGRPGGMPSPMGSLGRGWAELAAAEQELMRALRDYPGNPYINERLVQLRARQVDVLRQIAAADMTLRRRTI